MLALIRIRVKYIIRHPCLLFWSYLFLPIVIIIAAIVIITKKDSYSLKTSNSVSLIKSEFFQEAQGYPNIKRDFNFTGFLVDNKADCDKILGDVHVRSRREGDRIKLPKRPTKKLKSLLQEKRASSFKRSQIVVLADDNGPFWARGFGLDSRALVDKNSKNVLLVFELFSF